MDRLWELIDEGIEKLKASLSAQKLDELQDKIDGAAKMGIPIAIGVILVAGIIQGAKVDESSLIEAAVKASAIILGLGYLSHRFAEGCRNAGSDARSVLSLEIYLDLLIVAGALGTLGAILGALASIFDGNFEEAGYMLSSGFVALMVTWTLCNPARLGIRFDASSGAGNDVVSLISALVRVCLRIVIPISSVVILLASIVVLINLVLFIAVDQVDAYEYAGGIAGGTTLITMGVGAPLFVYLGYVVIAFIIGILENILSIKVIARNTAPASAAIEAAPVAPDSSGTMEDVGPREF